MNGVADVEAPVTDEELAALAMLADPDQPLGPDAVPFSSSAGEADGLLPDWYMPTAARPVRGPMRRMAVGGVVVALLALNCAGLCVTSGFIEIAW